MGFLDALEKEAAEIVRRELEEPISPYEDDKDFDEFFHPWLVFDCFYGTYSADFDWVAISVLEGLKDEKKAVWDLPSHMFREVLCNKNLCDYGTSPRACFPTTEFSELLPAFIAKWKEYYRGQWGEPYPDHGHTMMVRKVPL